MEKQSYIKVQHRELCLITVLLLSNVVNAQFNYCSAYSPSSDGTSIQALRRFTQNDSSCCFKQTQAFYIRGAQIQRARSPWRLNSVHWRPHYLCTLSLELPSRHCTEASNFEMVPGALQHPCTPAAAPGFYHHALACFNLPFPIHTIIWRPIL